MTFETTCGEDFLPLPTFLKNMYDGNGEIYERGYWLCFGSTFIKIAQDDDALGRFVNHINDMEQGMYDCEE